MICFRGWLPFSLGYTTDRLQTGGIVTTRTKAVTGRLRSPVTSTTVTPSTPAENMTVEGIIHPVLRLFIIKVENNHWTLQD